MNPLLENSSSLPKYAAIAAEHIEEAVDSMVVAMEQGFSKIENDSTTPSWENLIEEINKLEDWYPRVWSPVSHLHAVKNESALREAYQKALPKVVALGLKLSQSKLVFKKLEQLRSSSDWNTFDQGQKRSIEQRLLSAKLSGIGLEGQSKDRFNEIVTELSSLSTDFSNNVLDSTKEFKLILRSSAECEGLSDSIKEMLAHSYFNSHPEVEKPEDVSRGPWLVSLDGPVYIAFMQNSTRRELREKIYRAFVTRASAGEKDNTEIMQKILKLRHEKAKILGFANYAEVSLASKMAQSTGEVFSLLEALREASLEPAKRELSEIEAFAKDNGHKSPLYHWDIPFWAKRLEENKYSFTDEMIQPYFSIEKVLTGLFELTEKIFGIKVKCATEEASIWHQDVGFYKIFDESGEHIASFFLDPYSRPETKRGGAWMDDVVGKRVTKKERRIPVAHLVCNFTPPVGDKPSLLTFNEVETMFHEFGHGLQHMLTKIGYSDVSGISGVEWDAVELPSQFMENWCYHQQTLLGMAKHYKTGETLPLDLYRKINEARTYRAGMLSLRQLTFGLIDMLLHSSEKADVKAIEMEVAKKTAVLPVLPEDRSLCSFSHIFSGGYAAGYYSYKWAEVLSADAFEAFEEVGLENQDAVSKVGRKFKDTVLGLGGSLHPSEVFKLFRGRDPSPKALLRHSGLA
ncbi:MAG: M3 family metallopeptidase [Pseudomonadota bacterium]